MTGRPEGIVYFAPTIAAARRAARGAAGAILASPAAPAGLARALRSLAPVAVAEPARPTPAWKEAKLRFLLPPAPELLRSAIGGITTDRDPSGPAAAGGPDRAHWIPGVLTERRAEALLASPPVPRLWIVEDFRRLRLSPAMLRLLRRRGVRIAALRALRVRRRRR